MVATIGADFRARRGTKWRSSCTIQCQTSRKELGNSRKRGEVGARVATSGPRLLQNNTHLSRITNVRFVDNSRLSRAVRGARTWCGALSSWECIRDSRPPPWCCAPARACTRASASGRTRPLPEWLLIVRCTCWRRCRARSRRNSCWTR